VKVTDGQPHGGGNPHVKQEPPPPAPKPEPLPPPKKEIVKKEEEKPKLKEPKPIDKGDLPIKIAKKTPDKEPTKPLLTKPIKRTDTNLLAQWKHDADERARREKAETERAAAERKQFADAVNNIVRGTSSGLNKNSIAETPGPGGAAYVNYGSLVGETYKRAVYATQPQSDDDAEAVIKVLIGRSGDVRSSQWVRRTGNSLLDKAVDRAMNSVRSLPPFPSESKDSERTFNIRIAFEAKKVSA
jgi:TonB family protein